MICGDCSALSEIARHRWDVVVVGAGPAGSVAALELAHRGCAVLLVDKSTFPRWKVCGACLNPFALSILERHGVGNLPDQCGAVAIRDMILAVRRSQAVVALPGWKALSRERLDAALAQAAITAGATFLPRTRALLTPPSPEGRTVVLRRDREEQTVVACLVLAADGLGSQLLAGEEASAVRTERASRVGVGVIVESAPEFYGNGVIYMAYGKAGYLGLVRLEDGRLNIAAALNVTCLRAAHSPVAVAARLLREVGWPEIPELRGSPWHGTPALTRHPSRPASERVLAIGDAAGFIEPFTGEGMGWAMASGSAVVPVALRAVHDWHACLADQWTALHRRSAVRRQRLSRGITWVSRHPPLARALTGLVRRLPWLAGLVVNQIGIPAGA